MGNLDRIASYVKWPADSPISCLMLANSGFVYTGVADQVTCPLCGLVVGDWHQRNVNPRDEHRLRSPQCLFFSESSTNLGPESLNDRVTGPSSSSAIQRDSVPNIAAVYRSALERAQRHGLTDSHVRPTGSTATSRDPEAARIDRADPDYGLLKDESVRLTTFDDWPASDIVQPSDLARAGLFYTGQADRTRCAFCLSLIHI